MDQLDQQLTLYQDLVTRYLDLVESLVAHADRPIFAALLRAGSMAGEVLGNSLAQPATALAQVRTMLELHVYLRLVLKQPELEQRWSDHGCVMAELGGSVEYLDWPTSLPAFRTAQARLGLNYPPCFFTKNGWALPATGHKGAACRCAWSDAPNTVKKEISFDRLQALAGFQDQYPIFRVLSNHGSHAGSVVVAPSLRGKQVKPQIPIGIAAVLLHNLTVCIRDAFPETVTFGALSGALDAFDKVEAAIPDVSSEPA
jgi:hypothetical protein